MVKKYHNKIKAIAAEIGLSDERLEREVYSWKIGEDSVWITIRGYYDGYIDFREYEVPVSYLERPIGAYSKDDCKEPQGLLYVHDIVSNLLRRQQELKECIYNSDDSDERTALRIRWNEVSKTLDMIGYKEPEEELDNLLESLE